MSLLSDQSERETLRDLRSLLVVNSLTHLILSLCVTSISPHAKQIHLASSSDSQLLHRLANSTASTLHCNLCLCPTAPLHKVHVTPHTKNLLSTTGHIIGYRTTRTRVQSSFPSLSLFLSFLPLKNGSQATEKANVAHSAIQFPSPSSIQLNGHTVWLFLLFSSNFHRDTAYL